MTFPEKCFPPNIEFLIKTTIPELFLDKGMARGKSPCLSPGEIIESPMVMQFE